MICKCGKCGKDYPFEEFIRLIQVAGKYSNVMCPCGYRFFLDRWSLADTVPILIGEDYANIKVSTIFLELSHGYNQDYFYETMLFLNGIPNDYQERYKTKEEAIDGHNRIVRILKEGNYKITSGDNNEMKLLME